MPVLPSRFQSEAPVSPSISTSAKTTTNIKDCGCISGQFRQFALCMSRVNNQPGLHRGKDPKRGDNNNIIRLSDCCIFLQCHPVAVRILQLILRRLKLETLLCSYSAHAQLILASCHFTNNIRFTTLANCKSNSLTDRKSVV